jgi:hypothetical protein
MHGRRVGFLVLALSVRAFAQANELAGVWEGHHGRSVDTVTITDRYLAWEGPSSRNGRSCRTAYTIISKYTSDTYPDNHFSVRAGVTYDIYKLKLPSNDCIGYGYLLFALPSEGRINRNGETHTYALVLGYSEDDRYLSFQDFTRTKKD